MASNNKKSTILSEHRSVVTTRYILALINFIAILAGTLVTLFFVQRRGIYAPILVHIYILIGINIAQILLCLTEYVLRNFFGISAKYLPIVSYTVGGLWIAVLISEMIVATAEIGSLRVDLLVVAAIQFVIAVVAYLVWPMMDRRAIDAMIRPSVRDDDDKKKKKSKAFVYIYGVICGVVVLAQAGTLIAYKMPPKFYDLFSDTRALAYEYDEDLEGYVVTDLYTGTSNTVNIPATYNNKPVVGIAAGALIDDAIIDSHKVTTVTFGTEQQAEDGTTSLESNLFYISSGAIVMNTVDTLSIPASVQRIDSGAVKSTSIKTLNYSGAASFAISNFELDNLKTVVMSGETVGKISSLDGMSSSVNIEVDKNIYNSYREDNMDYVASFSPILPADEYVIDFFTDSDYYIDSIFCKVGVKVDLHYSDLRKVGSAETPISVDTEAYIKNPHEVNTDGAKADSAFRGWYTDAAFTNEFHFTEYGSDPIENSIKLYAKWIPEYTGTLKWGTHTPTSDEMKDNAEVLDEVHWTDEDIATFPVVSNRLGYSKGIVWKADSNDGEIVTTSRGISRSLDIVGEWQLDAPTVNITDLFTGLEAGLGSSDYIDTIDFGYVQYTYDELRQLRLLANPTHVLDDTVTPVSYSYSWVKEGEDFDDRSVDLDFVNVPDSGKYTLTVTALANNKVEKSVGTYDIEVKILRKQIVMEGVTLPDALENEYTGTTHTLKYVGTISSPNVKVTYSYYDKDGNFLNNDGVMNVGNYKVTAVIEKDYNYESVPLEAELRINKRKITIKEWVPTKTDDDFVYSGTDHGYKAVIENLVPGDDAGLVYSNNVKTNAGEYTAKVEDWTNENYALDNINRSHPWSITPKEVKVSYWQYGTGWAENSVTYNGSVQTIYAVAAGAIGSDDVRFTYQNTEGFVNSATNAGTYTAKINGVNNSNYFVNISDDNLENISTQWTINKKTLSLSFSDPGLIYSGAAQGITATVSGFATVDRSTLEGGKVGIFSYDLGANVATAYNEVSESNGNVSISINFNAVNAGEYEAGITTIANSSIDTNYALTGASESFAIAKKALSIDVDTSNTRTYNGQVQKLDLLVGGIVAADLDSFELSNFTSDIHPESGASNGKDFVLTYTGTEAGNYPVVISAFAGNTNYYLPDAEAGETNHLVINRRNITISKWQVIDKKDGNTTPADITSSSLTYNYYGYDIVPVLSNVVDGETVTLTLTNNSQTQAANYKIAASLDDSYTNYSFTDTTYDWTIAPKALDFTWKISGSDSIKFTYDGEEKQVVAVYNTINPEEVITLTYANEAHLKATNAASYNVTVTGTGNSNYVVGSGKTLIWSIVPREVTVVWTPVSNLVYSGEYQGPTFRIENLVDDGVEFVATTTSQIWNQETSTGSETFTVNNNTNYYFTDENGFAVDVGSYGITGISTEDGNYTVKDNGGSTSFAIAPKTINLTGNWSYTNNGSPYTPSGKPVYNKKEYTYVTTYVETDVVERLGVKDVISLNYGDTQKATNAGSYTTTVTGLYGDNCANYQLAAENRSASWEIIPKTVTFNWTVNSFVYDGAIKTQLASLTTNATSDSDGKIYNGDTVEITYKGNTGSNADTYTASVSALSNSNYTWDSSSENSIYEWKISSKPVTINWEYVSTTYSSKKQWPVAYYYNIDGKRVNIADSYVFAGDRDYTSAETEYPISVDSTEDTNYAIDGTSGVHSFNITKKQLTYNWIVKAGGNNVSTAGLVYDKSTRELVAEIDGVCDGDVITLNYSTETKFTGAGDYAVTITGIDGAAAENYDWDTTTTKSVSFTVAKQKVTISWSGNTSVVYDGSAHSFDYAATGEIDGTNNNLVRFTTESGTDVGTHSITLELVDKDNYVLTSGATSASKNLTITPQPVKITWSDDSFVYDGKSHSLIATVVGKNDKVKTPIAFHYVNDNSATHVNESKTVSVALDNSNYTLSGLEGTASKALTITPQPVSITWEWSDGVNTYDEHQNFTYVSGKTYSATATVVGKDDELDVEFSYANGNTGSAVAHTKDVKVVLGDTNYTTADAVGDVSVPLIIQHQPVKITWTWSDGTNSYTTKKNFTYSGTTYTLKPTVVGSIDNVEIKDASYSNYQRVNAGDTTVTVTSLNSSGANYTLDNCVGSKSAVLHVDKQIVTLEWAGAASTVVYDGNTHTYSVTAKGEDGVANSSLITVSKTGKNVGNYTITVTLNHPENYEFKSGTTESRALNIIKQTVSVEWSGDNSVIYDGESHTLTPTATGNGASANTNLINIGGTGTNAINVGEYTVTVTLKDSTNYVFADINDTSRTLTISKQPVRVSWSNKTVIYDGDSHTLTATATGERDGVDNSLINVIGSYTKAGTHTVTIELADPANYNFVTGTVTERTLTISPRPVTITWPTESVFTYDGKLHDVTPTVMYADGSGTKLTLGTEFKLSGTYRSTNVIDDSTVTLDFTSSNYTTTSSTMFSFTINPQPVKITWKWYNGSTSYNEYQDFVYNGTIHSVQATVVGKDSGTNVSFDYDGANTSFTAGTCTPRIVSLNDPNYTLDDAEGDTSATLSIAKRPVVLGWTDITGTYSGKAFTANPSISNWIAGNVQKLTFSAVTISGAAIDPDTNVITNAGTYKITLTGLGNDNYTLDGVDNCTITVTIAAAKPTVTWSVSESTMTYDGTYHEVYAIVTYADSTTQTITFDSFRDAGKYTYTLTEDMLNNNNHSLETITKTITVEPKALNVKWNMFTKLNYIYQPNAKHGYSISPDGVCDADINKVSFSYSGDLQATNAGNYSVTVTGLKGTASGNYKLSDSAIVTKEYTISPQPVTIVWEDTATDIESVWADEVRNRFVWIYGSLDNDLLYTGSIKNYEQTNGYVTILGAGIYTLPEDLSIDVLDEEYHNNYVFTEDSGEVNNTMTVTKQSAAVHWYLDGVEISKSSYDKIVSYDGKTHKLSAKIISADGTTLFNSDVGKEVGHLETAWSKSGKNVGTYELEIPALSDWTAARYELDEISKNILTRTMQIDPKVITVGSWSNYLASSEYDGIARNPRATLSGVVGSDVVNVSAYKYMKVVNGVETEEVSSIIDAGTYRVYVESVNNSNYLVSSSNYCELEIVPAVLQINYVLPEDGATTGTHTIDIQFLNRADRDTSVKVYFRMDYPDGTYYSVTDGSQQMELTQAGLYIIQITGVSSTNYTLTGIETRTVSFELNDSSSSDITFN